MKVNRSPSGGGNANHTALIAKTNTTPPYGGYGIISNEVNNVWMLQLASSSNNSWYGVNAESEFQIGEYETLVGTFNGESGSTKIYINGLLNNETNTFTGNIRSVGDNVEIGRNPQDSPNNECYYNGEISELVVFSREIGSDEVLLFDEGELVYTNNLVAHYKFNAGEGNVLYDQ